MNNYLVIDLETTIEDQYERSPNPFYQKVLVNGLKVPWYAAQSYTNLGWFETYLNNQHANIEILVGHNVKYDLLHLWSNNSLQSWLRRGGKIWDTQLAEYIITGQQSKYVSLRNLATIKYNRQERIKKIDENLKHGIRMENMALEDLEFDVKNDVLDTEAIYLEQLEVAKQQDQLPLIEAQMDALLATTEIEWNGLFVDTLTLINNRKILEKELEETKSKLQELVKAHWK